MASVTDDAALQFPILIGDIGGTNARFAILADASAAPIEFPNVRTADYATIDDAIRLGIVETTTVKPRSTVLAIAGPVDGDEIPLTNCPWVVKPRGMRATTGISEVDRAQRFRGAGAGRGGARRGAYGEDRRRASPKPAPAASCSAPAPGSASPA